MRCDVVNGVLSNPSGWRLLCRSCLAGILARSSAAQDAHEVVHFGRNAVVADHRARVAQTDRLALDHEAPQRVAGFPHEFGVGGTAFGMAALVLGERGKRRLQRPSHPAKRCGLLLRNFVVERGKA
jgi:hypothetical protein